MRIVAVSNMYPPHVMGGYEEACRDAVEGLRARGHHVEVVTTPYGLDRPVVAPSLGVHRTVRIDPFWSGAFRSDTTAELWRWNLSATRSLRAVLQATRPDVAYVWSMLGMPMSLLTTLREAGLPLVFNLQDNWLYDHLQRDLWLATWAYRSRRPLRRGLKEALRRGVDPVVPTRAPCLRGAGAQFISRAFARAYAERGWHFAHERVIYNGLDLDHFRPRAHRRAEGPRRLLFLSRLDAVKGAHTAIAAMALLAAQRGRNVATLTVVGSSNDALYQERLHAMVRAAGLEDLVTFRGVVPRAETAAIYAAHDMLLFPSTWPEGFSLVLLEALASGLPVVGTATGGSAEILEDGVTGLVVAGEDPAALAGGVGRLLDNPVLAHRLGVMGAQVVRDRFDQRHIITQVEDFLSRVIESAHGHGIAR